MSRIVRYNPLPKERAVLRLFFTTKERKGGTQVHRCREFRMYNYEK
jgi:hypothetical protein